MRTDAHIVFRTSDVLGNNSRWLGEQGDQHDALHAVPEPFNSALTYIAFFDGSVQELINLSYMAAAPGDPPFTYTPILVGTATREQLLALSTTVSEIDTRVTALEEADTGGQGLSPQDVQLLELLKKKVADIILDSNPTWMLADETLAQFTTIALGSTASQHLSNRQPPTGATGWNNDRTETSTRALVIRIKPNQILADYRILFAVGTWLPLDAFLRYSSDADWVYYAENPLVNVCLLYTSPSPRDS